MKKLIKLIEKIIGSKLKDEKQKDMKLSVTGSVGSLDTLPTTPTTEEISNASFDVKQVDEIMEKILSLDWVEKDLKDSVQPVYMLKSDKQINWFYSLSKKSFCQVSNYAEILAIDHATEDTSYCLINNDYFEVDNELIYYIGWN